jgi:hypothetical protein
MHWRHGVARKKGEVKIIINNALKIEELNTNPA